MFINDSDNRLNKILDDCSNDIHIPDEDLNFLLTRTDKKDLEAIFEAARYVRSKNFASGIFLYGFVYFSTYCKNNCSFCYYRRENDIPLRYRKNIDEILETAVSLKESGVHLLDLTTGDDPYYTENPEILSEIIKSVKTETDLPVMISPGVLASLGLDMTARAGADWYALYQETHNRELFKGLRLGQSYEKRMESKLLAKEKGLLLEEGLLVGIYDTPEDKIQSFKEMKKMGISQARAMTFVPQKGAPLCGEGLSNCDRELLTIAVMRLVFPDILIPASLDVEGLMGLETRLNAGANVVTSIIPPKKGYAGVAMSQGDIDDGKRTVEGISETVEKCGLTPCRAAEYKQWISDRKRMMI